MNVLFVLPSFPLPADSGAAIAAVETLRSLYPHCNLSLLVPPPRIERDASEARLRQLLPGVMLHIYAGHAAPSHAAIYRAAALSLLTGRCYWELIWRDRGLRAAVVRLTANERFDVVLCEWLQPAVSLQGLDLPLVVREHDVHFIRMRDGAASRGSGLGKMFWQMQARRLRAFEIGVLSDAAAVVTLSVEDEAILRGEGVRNVCTIAPPCGIPVDLATPSRPDGRALAVFIGRLDDDVNREAFFLFAREVWPRVRADVRVQTRVVFAGGVPDDAVRRGAAECGLEIQAPLSDADAGRLLAAADIVLLPITSGTGIKIKTLNAMSRGKATIGFANAFRGVGVTNGSDALIAESAEDFAGLIEMLIEDPSRRGVIGAAARELIRVQFDPDALALRLIDVYRRVSSQRA